MKDLERARCGFRARADTLQFGPPAVLLGGAGRNELIREHMAERIVVASPADADQVHQRLGLEALEIVDRAPHRPECIGADQHEVRDPLRMAPRVGDRHGAALRHADQRKSLEAKLVDHGFEIADPGIERQAARCPVRQAAAPLVIAQVLVPARQLAQPGSPDGALEVVFDMAQPMRGTHQRRAAADRRHCDARAVCSGAEADVLPRGHPLILHVYGGRAISSESGAQHGPWRFSSGRHPLTSGLDERRIPRLPFAPRPHAAAIGSRSQNESFPRGRRGRALGSGSG